MEDSGELKIQPSEFFIPSTYINSQNSVTVSPTCISLHGKSIKESETSEASTRSRTVLPCP